MNAIIEVFNNVMRYVVVIGLGWLLIATLINIVKGIFGA